MYLSINLMLFILVSVQSLEVKNPDKIFESAYSECLMKFSYVCLQRKTLSYLKMLNGMSEVSLLGNYVKFVKFNSTLPEEDKPSTNISDTTELTALIDKAVDSFFETHALKVRAMGRELSTSRSVNEFVGRKKRKGGGGGGDHGGDHDGKKKMMMMAMLCMKMKMMMMIPAMMGMMGMMSFKGMMFSMMSFMISKMMLVMKLLEKRGGLGGAGGGSDGGWAASGGGGGAWMPAGGQDYAGGGYDANGQWQSRSMLEKDKNKPTINYVTPTVRIIGKSVHGNEISPNNDHETIHRVIKRNADENDVEIMEINNIEATKVNDKEVLTDDTAAKRKCHEENNIKNLKNSNNTNKQTSILIGKLKKVINEIKYEDNTSPNIENRELKVNGERLAKVRTKRDIIDLFQNSYRYVLSKLFGANTNRRTATNKYKVVNGIKYVYYPFKMPQKLKTGKEINSNKVNENFKITTVDFNKGEIVEGGVESRMNRKKFNKFKNNVNETLDENPWE